jgi:hypothetical protein
MPYPADRIDNFFEPIHTAGLVSGRITNNFVRCGKQGCFPKGVVNPLQVEYELFRQGALG